MLRIVSCACCTMPLLCEYCAEPHATATCLTFAAHVARGERLPDDGDATPEECAAIGLRLVA